MGTRGHGDAVWRLRVEVGPGGSARAGAFVTGAEWREAYLVPLAQSDLLVDTLREKTEVVAVERLTPVDDAEPEDDGDERDWDDEESDETEDSEVAGPPNFTLRFRRAGREAIEQASAHVVIDASGVMNLTGWLSGGPEPAPGEAATAARIAYDVPDVRGHDRANFAGRQTLVVGGDMAGQSCFRALVELAANDSATKVTWLGGLTADFERLLLPAAIDRAALVAAGQIESLAASAEGKLVVRLGEATAPLIVDRVVSTLTRRDGVEFIAGAQSKLAGTRNSTESGQSPSGSRGTESYQAIAPDFYCIGTKSFTGYRSSAFSFADGLEQIRQLFALLMDRAALDLYATMDALLP